MCVYFLLQAVLYYTESLKSVDIKIQQSSCLALKCLRVSRTQIHTVTATLGSPVFRTLWFLSASISVGLFVCFCFVFFCQATESVDHIADLWRSTDEDLRSAARETVLSFGTSVIPFHHRVIFFIYLYCIFISFITFSFNLSAGKKGYQAYQRMDQLDTEMQDEAYQNQETEITIL